MQEKYFKELLKLAQKAAKKNEVPVSALIVKNDKIIAKSLNSRQKTKIIFNHAEINAIIKASKKLKTWHLNDCDLYVSLKPCTMCEQIIRQTQIKNVFYLLDKLESKKEYNKTIIAKANISMLENEYSQYLRDFFKKRRDKE